MDSELWYAAPRLFAYLAREFRRHMRAGSWAVSRDRSEPDLALAALCLL